jgi:hypothetical protein
VSEWKNHGGTGKENQAATGASAPLKGAAGRQQMGGGVGENWPTRGGLEAGALALTGGDSLDGAAGSGPSHGARKRRTCPHNRGRRRVADGQGPDGSGRAQGSEARGARGPAVSG